METLLLANNVLTNISSSVFNATKRLQNLNLDSNRINLTSHNAFSGLRDLQLLSLRSNKLGYQLNPSTEEYDTVLENVSGADHIRLERRPVVLLSVEALDARQLPGLRTLDLGANPFSVILSKSSPFAKPSRNPYRVSGDAASTVESASMLQQSVTINASTSGLMEEEGEVWSKLQELRLDGCFIELIEASSFEGLISLSILRIHDNSLTVSEVSFRYTGCDACKVVVRREKESKTASEGVQRVRRGKRSSKDTLAFGFGQGNESAGYEC